MRRRLPFGASTSTSRMSPSSIDLNRWTTSRSSARPRPNSLFLPGALHLVREPRRGAPTATAVRTVIGMSNGRIACPVSGQNTPIEGHAVAAMFADLEPSARATVSISHETRARPSRIRRAANRHDLDRVEKSPAA